MRAMIRGAEPSLVGQAVLRLPARHTLALLEPGLGIINITGITDGQTTGGGIVPPLDEASGGSSPTAGTVPTTGLPLAIPSF
jgi:hypothetical protein